MKKVLLLIILAIAGVIIAIIVMSGGEKRSYNERTATFDNRAQKYTEIGFEFKKENRFEDAERAFLKAIELDPAHEKQAYLGIGEVYRFALKEKDSKTPEILLRGLSYDEKDIILLRALAQYFERTGNFSQARHWYGKITEYYPNDLPAKQKLQEVGY